MAEPEMLNCYHASAMCVQTSMQRQRTCQNHIFRGSQGECGSLCCNVLALTIVCVYFV